MKQFSKISCPTLPWLKLQTEWHKSGKKAKNYLFWCWRSQLWRERSQWSQQQLQPVGSQQLWLSPPVPWLPDISDLREFKPCPRHSHQSPCGGKRWGHEAPGHHPAHVLLHFLFGFVAFEANKSYSMVKTLLMGKIINQQVCWIHSIWYRVGGLQGTSVLLLWKGRAQFPRNL